jgi:manganese/zinc/iron transport system permease protein
MSIQLEIQLVAALVAAACTLPGVFLVLRRMSLVSDAISHTVLFGIVIGFGIVGDLHNPLLFVGAVLSGVLTVSLSELLLRTRRVQADAAIGLVFPVLFSIAVILISRNFSGVHLDTDAVLLGELAFAPFNRSTILGLDLPRGVWMMGAILLLNIALIVLFYKELKLATFDAGLAAALGFAPGLIHYGLMTSVSITAVGAFDHVGAILVVALMIAPPATAYLLTDRLARMLGLSALIGAASAISGYWVARWIGDVNIAGAMASMTGVFFLLALIFAPQRGLLARRMERQRRRQRFAVEMLLVHLSRHEGAMNETAENSLAHLTGELNWKPAFADGTVRSARQQGLIEQQNGTLRLTADGRERAELVLQR